MSKRKAITNDSYLDSKYIVHEKRKLSTILNILLDRYSEGTFVPRLMGNEVEGTGEYEFQTGEYKKIGNIVFFNFTLCCKKLVGAQGLLLLSGFPHKPASSPNNFYLDHSGNGLLNVSSQYSCRAYFVGNAFLIEPFGGINSVMATNFTGTQYIYATGFYFSE